MALLVDYLIQGAVFFCFALLMAILSWENTMEGDSEAGWVGYFFYFLMIFFFQWFYHTLFELWWNGQTPGKRMMGIQVISRTGEPLEPGAVIMRNLLRGIDSFPWIYVVGFITSLLDRQKRRLGDMISDTVVVQKTEPTFLFPSSLQVAVAASPQGRYRGVRPLTEHELFIIRRVLAGNGGPSGGKKREQMLTSLADKVSRALGVTFTGDPETFLKETYADHSAPVQK